MVPTAIGSTPVLLCIEHEASALYRVVVINSDPNAGLGYHPSTASNVVATTAAAASETQAKLDALVKAVTTLPEGARVLHSVFSSPGALGSPTSETSEPEPPETSGATAEEDAPPPTGGAPPSPEHADGLDEEHEPCAQPRRRSRCLAPSLSRHPGPWPANAFRRWYVTVRLEAHEDWRVLCRASARRVLDLSKGASRRRRQARPAPRLDCPRARTCRIDTQPTPTATARRP